MHPPTFVEFHFDTVRRIDSVFLAFVFDAAAQLEKHFAQPLAAFFEGGFLVRVILWIEGEGEKQFTAHIGQTVPNPRQNFVDADRMKPRSGDVFLYGLLKRSRQPCGRAGH